jgi:hypothetical protein
MRELLRVGAALVGSAALVACSSGGSSRAGSTTTDASTSPDTGMSIAPEGGPPPEGGSVVDAETDAEVGPGSEAGGPTLGGCPLFGPQFAYNVDVSSAALDAKSATYIAGLKASAPVIGLDYPGGEIYNVVPASQASVPVQTQGWYGFTPPGDTFFFEADAGGAVAPIPSGVMFENQGTANADHHLMVLQQGSCQLFEMYAWNPTGPTTGWSALVQWDLRGSSEQIPDALEIGSTTAAGTPLLPGVIWPEEVAAGEIRHAVDIVMPAAAIAKCQYVHPASDGAWTATGTFPYGGRLRLKASYDTSTLTGTQALVVIRALQRYGMFNTDISGETRSSFRLGGLGSQQGWVQSDITQLGKLTWDDFDVVDLGTVQTMKGCQ